MNLVKEKKLLLVDDVFWHSVCNICRASYFAFSGSLLFWVADPLGCNPHKRVGLWAVFTINGLSRTARRLPGDTNVSDVALWDHRLVARH